jgi:7,8-dihydropterin-6-yl-methyl-4-(beta-D-ribofuranosyl)aminobenzene 5'-phosphate synthase
VSLAGKGIVLISGCGHPGIVSMARHASLITNEPVFAAVGGLHLVVTHGRDWTQKLVAASSRRSV